MSFLQNLHAFGTVETTRSYSYSKHLDPIQRLRMNFIENAKRQIVDVQSGEALATNAWVSKKTLGGGRFQYKVSLRVGPKLIRLPGGTHVVMNSSEKVVQFLEGIIGACEAGELDDLLQETSGKNKNVSESKENDVSGMN
jgi:hypothetical protein